MLLWMYVVLHRSEGLKLSRLDAMARGKVVIMTNYSRPATYKTLDTAFILLYNLVTIEEDQGLYKVGNH